METILKHGIKANRRDDRTKQNEHSTPDTVTNPQKSHIFKELWTNGKLHELASILFTCSP